MTSHAGGALAEPRMRGLFAAMLALAMAAGGFLRAALPVLSVFVIDEFGLTTSEFGFLLTAYMVSLVVGAAIMGRLTDVLGGKRALIIRFVVGAGGIVGLAIAPGFPWFVAVVVLNSLVMGGGNPSTNKLIATHVPVGRRGTVMGLKQSGGQLGPLYAGLVLPTLALATSWRVSLLSGLVFPAAALVLLLLIVPTDSPVSRRREAPISALDRRLMVRLALISLTMGMGTAATFGFLPLYAQEAVGTSAATAGLLMATMALVATVGRVVWARQSERSRHYSVPLAALAFLSIMATLAIISATEFLSLLWVGAISAGASLESFNSVGNMAVVALVPIEHAGRASGFTMAGFLIGGSVSPALFGIVVDAAGYRPAWGLLLVCYSTALLLSLRWRWTASQSALEAAA